MVVNILSDGTIVKDMTGYVVPVNESTKTAYELLIRS